MKTFYMVQYSPEWWEARRGLATASSFDKIITAAKATLSSSMDDYICELIGDLRDLRPNAFSDRGRMGTPEMEAGRAAEPEARRWYEMERGLEVQQVGGCRSDCGRLWASPDGMVGDDGVLELKCPLPKIQAGYLMRGVLPMDYRQQVHGQLIVTGRKWVDFVSYCPPFDPFIIRVTPDEYTQKLRDALEVFVKRYDEILLKLVGKPFAELIQPEAESVVEPGF